MRDWGKKNKKTHIGHNVLSKIGICISPRSAVLNHFVGACSPEFGHHQWRGSGGHHDGAVEVEGARRVDSRESGIATARGENVRP